MKEVSTPADMSIAVNSGARKREDVVMDEAMVMDLNA
jgi:hypothetical protein